MELGSCVCVYEDITLLRINDLQAFVQNEIDNINSDTDTVLVTAKLMYKILQFSVENNNRNEHILHNECWKYWEVCQDEFMDKIP